MEEQRRSAALDLVVDPDPIVDNEPVPQGILLAPGGGRTVNRIQRNATSRTPGASLYDYSTTTGTGVPQRTPAGRRRRQVMPNLGVLIVTFAPIPFREMADVARTAEDLDYARIYTSESLTDTLAVDMWLASQTKRITVASGITILYMRHPLIMAEAAT
ncbi:MAG: LLM class flavin-dependent oxidoreductase, partial [Dehalococcoidia bacterium]|nr:LLM class flavin-dependent oxidoreductase [Dehalococcoidia bacterium]